MRFFNYRFHQKDGISKANWYTPSMASWRTQGLPFIAFKSRISFGQHHLECFPDYNMLRIRVGNWRLTLHFNFVNCEFNAPVIYGESIARTLVPFWKIYKNSGLSIKDIRKGISIWNSSTITAKEVIENIKRSTRK